VVWKLDRLGRSMRHLVYTVTLLEARNVGFRSLQESIATTSSTGRLIFHVFAALAEFERDLIRERTQAGLAAARARGRSGGRPAVMTPTSCAWPVSFAKAVSTRWPRSGSAAPASTDTFRPTQQRGPALPNW
jgi:hypothetical protein